MNESSLFRFWFCVALPVLLIGLLGCPACQTVSPRLTPHITSLYTIGVPEGWHVRNFPETNPILTFVSNEPILDDFLTVVYSGDEWAGPGFLVFMPMEAPPSPDVTEWVFPGDELLEEQTESLIDGSLVRQGIYRTDQAGRQVVRWRAVVLSECTMGLVFILEATAPAGQWEEYWPLFQAIRDSFVTHGKWPEPPVAMDTYEGETFRINYYQDWEAQSEEGKVYFSDALPIYENFSVIVSLPLEAIPRDLSEAVYRRGTVVLEDSVEIAGRQGYELVQSVKSGCPYSECPYVESECPSYVEWQAVVVGGSPPVFYHFYASADADVWEQRAWPLIQEMRDSFEIIGEE